MHHQVGHVFQLKRATSLKLKREVSVIMVKMPPLYQIVYRAVKHKWFLLIFIKILWYDEGVRMETIIFILQA